MITAFDVTIFWNPVKKKIMYSLNKDYTFEVRGQSITVPKEYETDFGTTPQFSWSLGFPPTGKHNPGALVHDYLYDQRTGTRYEADKIFLTLMLQYGVPKFKAYTMYYAVRMFGKSWWKS